MSIQPYIGDEAVKNYCDLVVKPTYQEAGREPDSQYPVWSGRAIYDHAVGSLSWPASCAKHERELREALGLGPVVPPVGTLPRLVVNGQFFALETGERWTAIECSDFNLFSRYQSGEDITPILAQRRDVGFNLLRVWTLFSIPNIGHLLDPDYGLMRTFLRLCANYGLYVEFTAFTSTERPAHWTNLIAAVQYEPNVLVELVNEGDLPVNRIEMDRYEQPTGVLASHGSASSETIPPWEPWSYGTLHYNDADQWPRKTAHNPMEDFANEHQRPAMANENTRYPDRDASVTHAYDAAAGAALLTAGSCFHSVSGKSSVLWQDAELNAATEWAAGARSVPLEFQAGQYIHRIDLETPDLLRVYERRLADGRGFIVTIRR